MLLIWILLCWQGEPRILAVQAAERPFLAARHAAAGIACPACHGETPPEQEPPTAGCVRCHGELGAMGERTRKTSPNPHRSHMGEVECRM